MKLRKYTTANCKIFQRKLNKKLQLMLKLYLKQKLKAKARTSIWKHHI